jgi:hypothetical protein
MNATVAGPLRDEKLTCEGDKFTPIAAIRSSPFLFEVMAFEGFVEECGSDMIWHAECNSADVDWFKYFIGGYNNGDYQEITRWQAAREVLCKADHQIR